MRKCQGHSSFQRLASCGIEGVGSHGARVMQPLVRANASAEREAHRAPAPAPAPVSGQELNRRRAGTPPPCARSRRGTGYAGYGRAGCAHAHALARPAGSAFTPPVTSSGEEEQRGRGTKRGGQKIFPVPYAHGERK